MSRFGYYEKLPHSERLKCAVLNDSHIFDWIRFFEDSLIYSVFPMMRENDAETNARQWFDRQYARYRDGKYGMLALYDHSGNFIGQSGLLVQEANGKQELEVGYHIMPEYRGHGYAPEAARMFFTYGFEVTDAESIVSLIKTDNTNSIRVAEKNGLSHDGTTIWNNLEIAIYRIKRGEWLNKTTDSVKD